MVSIIKIEKDNIPYSFEVLLNETYRLYFKWNELADQIVVDLHDVDDNPIFIGETMVYNQPLWWSVMEDIKGNLRQGFPDNYLIPRSVDGVERDVNFENLQDKIVLTVLPREATYGEFDFTFYDNDEV